MIIYKDIKASGKVKKFTEFSKGIVWIGRGTVVIKDVPSNLISVGNSNRIIKRG